MVMEAPTPQCVGREFVRQYYTLLNEAPHCLHRFYNNQSIFIHGGVEKAGEEQEPVVGQTNIHKKILSLSFKDCHAKIRQVDSQESVNASVVVQVTGELSNNGEPMRRFMQTFVLAPQAPKKYYVHNDIFRYQDEVFHDTDESEEEGNDPSCECAPNTQAQPPVDHQDIPEQTIYNQNPVYNSQPLAQQNVTPPSSPHEQPLIVEKPLTNGQYESPAPVDDQIITLTAEAEPEPVESYETAVAEVEVNPEPTAAKEQTAVDEKPRSWASMVNNNSASLPVATPLAPVATLPPPKATAAPELTMLTPVAPAEDPQTAPKNARPQSRDHRGMGNRGDRGSRSGYGPQQFGNSGEDFEERKQRYPDHLQVFVGNLPHDVAEPSLKEFFMKFGDVQDVRINRSQANKVPFGFVVFENPESVQTVLQEKRVEFHSGHRLNVEEKKAKDNRSNANRRPNARDGMVGKQYRGGPRGSVGPREGSGSRSDGRSSNSMNRGGQGGLSRR